MIPYYIPNSYSAQMECAGISFRCGYRTWGIAPNHSFWCRPAEQLPKWYRLFFPISLGFNYHSSQKDQVYRFKLTLGGFEMWFLTEGDGADEKTGFHIALRGLKNYRIIV